MDLGSMSNARAESSSEQLKQFVLNWKSAISPAGFSLIASILMLLYAYYDVLARLMAVWGKNPDYSHGYAVPVFMAYLVYRELPFLISSKLGSRRFGKSCWPC